MRMQGVNTVGIYSANTRFGYPSTQTSKNADAQSENEQMKSIHASNLNLGRFKEDGLLKNLQSQLERAQEGIGRLAENEELTVEEKLELKKELDAQIEAIKNQISARQAELREQEQEKIRERIEKTAEEIREKQKSTSEVARAKKNLKQMGTMDAAMKEINDLSSVRVRLKGQLGVAQSELSAAKSQGEDVLSKQESVSDIEATLNDIENELYKKIGELNKEVRESREEELKNIRKSPKNIEDSEQDTGLEKNIVSKEEQEEEQKKDIQERRDKIYSKRIDIEI